MREGLQWKARSAARTWNGKPDPQRSEGARPNTLLKNKY